MRKLGFILLFLGIITVHASVQTQINSYNSLWTRWQFNDKITSKLRWELMLQYRSQGVGEGNFNILEKTQLRAYWTWLHYNPTPAWRISLMPLCQFETYPLVTDFSQNNRPVKEFRWAVRSEYQQKFKYFQLVHRGVMEYRWRDIWGVYDYVLNWRFRYMFRIIKPLRLKFLKDKPLNVIFFNEILLQFGEAVKDFPTLFDQNRISLGINYEIFKNVRAELGLMYVLQQRRTSDFFDAHNALTFTLTFDNVFSQWFPKK